eukprot:TRINITY_DN4337_c0_g1_i6.p3 TRINITY_DN4337_c0_g1~~TRINITY_DN4337_c0_g1_i6.p3  ORF type:complete len:107 (+),score=22.25 TRINITY_DN4337_c0_g1_i6:87-407(+)
MFASRAAFGMARNAARRLAVNPGMMNSAVRGGSFCQNCFVAPQLARAVHASALQQSEDGLLSSSEDATSLSVLESDLSALLSTATHHVAYSVVGACKVGTTFADDE